MVEGATLKHKTNVLVGFAGVKNGTRGRFKAYQRAGNMLVDHYGSQHSAEQKTL